jgi:DNA-binding NarL/FixJ family response regulator
MREAACVINAYNVPVTCLIVDDNSFFLDSASELLAREGLKVVGIASTSAEALQLVSELRPDVALVDIDLGEEDGFELARRLTGLEPPTTVILVSAHPEAELAELISASPAAGFVQKTQLSAKTIREALERAA